MDPERFDRLTASISRRTSLLGLVIGGTAAAWLAPHAAGKKKKCKQGKKCRGKVCGNFGCKGRSCGSCPSGQTCNGQGQCDPCTPNCSGKQCGSNGCSGNCGTCSGNDTCNAQGKCEACTPNCTGKTCGDDGCGGQCGPCAPENICRTATCTLEGQCNRGNLPNSSPCGPSGELCRDGQCIARPTCKMSGDACAGAIDCCSGTCSNPGGGVCTPSGIGRQCIDNDDCSVGLICFVYQCAQADD